MLTVHVRSARRPGPRGLAPRVLLVGLVLLGLGACGAPSASSASSGAEAPTVVATTTILGDVTRQVVGDAAEVVTLMPVGTDPHAYQPSAQELERLLSAELIVSNGGNLEESLTNALNEALRSGVTVFTAVEHVATLPLTEGSGDHAADDGGAVDPHIWMDPVRMARVTRALGAELSRVLDDPGCSDRAQDYAQRLEAGHERFAERLASIPAGMRTLVTNHDSLAYFADRYDFQIVGTVIPSVSTGAEPSAEDLEQLAETLRRRRVRAIFTDSTAPQRLAQTLIAEAEMRADVVPLFTGSLGADGSGAATYLALLETDVARIAAALDADTDAGGS
ncbi:MAG: metal ABC transporter solute-binding protein, Zn/Mn family [Egibacteraceae bacterium]